MPSQEEVRARLQFAMTGKDASTTSSKKKASPAKKRPAEQDEPSSSSPKKAREATVAQPWSTEELAVFWQDVNDQYKPTWNFILPQLAKVAPHADRTAGSIKKCLERTVRKQLQDRADGKV